jgi:SAM-dependent methyltransferase
VKTIVSLQELLEVEIRPATLFAEYCDMVRSSIPNYFPPVSRRPVRAPCHGGGEGRPAFEKWGFTYRECEQQGSLFVSPRPDEAALIRYYRESPAARFWHDRVLHETEEARHEKLIAPRVDWVLEGVVETVPAARTVLDLSFGAQGLGEGLLAAGIGLERVIHAGPTADLDHARARPGIEVRPSRLAGVCALGQVDVVTAFDAVDRAADVLAFVSTIRDVLRPGGCLFLTAPTSSGFEVQLLRERSRTVLPPDKLNLLSVEALRALFAPPDWELVELSTPGVLDVELVRRAVTEAPDHPWPSFVRYIMQRRGEDALRELQLFLQRYRLTSFARIVARRRESE